MLLDFARKWILPLAIVAGVAAYVIYVNIPALDSTHAFVARLVSVLQPALIFLMLFLTFLTIGPRDLRIHKWHWKHLGVQLAFFVLFAGVLVLGAEAAENSHWRILVESAMLCLLCPTATAAAVVTRKLGGNPADTTTYTVMINMAIALSAPLLLPLAHPHATGAAQSGFLSALGLISAKVFPLLIMPLASAWAVRAWLPGLARRLREHPDAPFYLWAFTLSLAIAVTVKAMVHSPVPWQWQAAIGLVALLCCLLQFAIGRRIGAACGSPVECAQALGQKNTVFIIWLGYTFLSPVTALAGGMYSVWHNIYNAWQLAHHKN